MTRFFILFLSLATAMLNIEKNAYAQTDSTKQTGKITSGEVRIVKKQKNILPLRTKPFQSVEIEDFQSTPMKMAVKQPDLDLDLEKFQTVAPIILPTEKRKKIVYKNYVLASIGNYTSGHLASQITRKLKNSHLLANVFYTQFGTGPVNKKESSSHQQSANLYLDVPFKNSFFKTYVQYEGHGYKFYGNSTQPAMPARYDQIKLGTSYKKDLGLIQYAGHIGGNGVTQSIRNGTKFNQENFLFMKGDFSFPLDSVLKIGLDFDLHSGKYVSKNTMNRTLLSTAPYIKYGKKKVHLFASLNIVYNVAIDEQKVRFFPNIHLTLNSNSRYTLFGFFNSGMQWNGLHLLLSNNEFLNQDLDIYNPIKNWEFGAGIQLKFIPKLLLEAKLALSEVNNYPLFILSISDTTRYTVRYDTQMGVTALKLGINYGTGTSAAYFLKININSYTPTALIDAWHLPRTRLVLGASHQIGKKITWKNYLTVLGAITAPQYETNERTQLPTITDLGTDLKFRFHKKATIFLVADNLLNIKYERYIGYPVRGLTLKIGGQYFF